MKRTGFIVAAIAATSLLAAGPASAQDVLSKDQSLCRFIMAKTFTKTVDAGFKVINKCHKLKNKGVLPSSTDCNDLSSDAKFAGSQAKLDLLIDKKCGASSKLDATAQAELLESYVSCPEPCSTDLGLNNPLQSISDLSQCLQCAAGNLAETAYAGAHGAPDQATISADKDLQKCAFLSAKMYQLYVKLLGGQRVVCQKKADFNGVKNNDAGEQDHTICGATDPNGKGAGALAKARDLTDKFCTGADFAALMPGNSCTAGTPSNVTEYKACADEIYEDLVDNDYYPLPYAMESTICPTDIQLTINGTPTAPDTDDTVLHLGFEGLSHHVDINRGYTVTGTVTGCDNPSPPCGTCTINGVSPNDPNYDDFLRCIDDVSVSCTTPFAADAACGGGECGVFLGPPLPLSSGGTPTVSELRIASAVTGTMNPDTGEGEVFLDLRPRVFNGLSVTEPAPLCEADVTRNDGSKDGYCVGGSKGSVTCAGTCQGGLDDGNSCSTNADCRGEACDAQGENFTFGSTQGLANIGVSGPSLDCPRGGSQLATLKVPLNLTTGASSFAAADACDAPNGAESCHCGQCSGDADEPCTTDTDCSNQGLGSCEVGNGTDRKPNGCGSFANCTAGLDTAVGECSDVFEQFCDGFVRANGRGVIGCSSNSECDGYGGECDGDADGNGCGACTIVQARSCFLDPIQVSGSADPINPVLGGTGCLPPTGSSSIDLVVGAPGPLAVKIDATITTKP